MKNTYTKIEELKNSSVNIPLDDYEAWVLYPKYRWVYSTSRLLEFQNIEWSPFYTSNMNTMLDEINFNTHTFPQVSSGPKETMVPGKIFVHELAGDCLTTDVAILKGEMKWAKHHTTDPVTFEKSVVEELRGDIELRISALARIHFLKFAGIISVDTIGHDMVSCRLHTTTEIIDSYEEDWAKRAIRIYNRRPWGK